MGIWAKIDSNNIVTEIIVAGKEFVDHLGTLYPDDQWIEAQSDDGTVLRGTYPSSGHVYDAENDKFYLPQPFESWTLNTTTWTWQAPVVAPDDGNLYFWEEFTKSWMLNPYQPPPIE